MRLEPHLQVEEGNLEIEGLWEGERVIEKCHQRVCGNVRGMGQKEFQLFFITHERCTPFSFLQAGVKAVGMTVNLDKFVDRKITEADGLCFSY